MNRVTVTVPDAVFEQLQGLADKEGVSVNQYVTYAIANHIDQETPIEAPQADWLMAEPASPENQTVNEAQHPVESGVESGET